MGFYIIKGTYHVVNYSPDGDSIRFKADNSENWHLLDGASVALNGNKHAQLRLEAIDTLETHYKRFHQPLNLAHAATDFLLNKIGITNVIWNQARTKIISANDGVRGYILARAVERNHRPISFAFAGDPPEDDWTSIEFYADRLSESLNYKSILEGMAYPTYYQGLFPDLRLALTQAAATARQQRHGVWENDVTNIGFAVSNLDAIVNTHIILPKLFRRLVEFLEGGGTLKGFKDYLESLNEGITIISSTHFTHFDFVIDIQGDVVRMIELPENIIFTEC